MSAESMRIGHGYDVHRFLADYTESKPLILAGVTLPDQMSLDAHSDGDLVLHALCDAILGALGEGDIGEHFPDTDAQFAGADSAQLLQHVLQLMQARNFQLINVDITVVAQTPKLAPHRGAMKAKLQELLGLDATRVNIKATTTEGLGDIGRKLGISCHAVVLLHERL